jgi:plastocyanin
VEWTNYDPTPHTVTGEGWGSELLAEGGRYVRRFDQPGRYPYRCLPHPQMTGVVIVEAP